MDIYLDGAVAPGGDGTSWATAYGAGEWAAAFTDFSTGVGNTMHVRNYTHASPVVMPAGSAGNVNTLKGYNATAAINGVTGTGVDMSTDYIALQDFQVSNCTGSGIGGNSGVHNVREVTGCKIFGNGSYGAVGFSGLYYTKFEDNDVYNNGNTGVWIFTANSHSYKNCNSYGNTGNGFEVRDDGVHTIFFEDCTAYENSQHGFSLNYDDIDLRGTFESKENQDYGMYLTGIRTITATGKPLLHRNWDANLYIRAFDSGPHTVTLSRWQFSNSLGISSENWGGSTVNVSRCTFVGCWVMYRPAFNLGSGTINFIDCIHAFGSYGVDGRNYSYGGTISYTLFDDLLNGEIINGALFSLGAGNVTGSAKFFSPSWQGSAPNYNALDFRISDTGDAVGMSSTSGDVGAWDSMATSAPGVPIITAAPNADEISIDVTLAAMPANADTVYLYKRTATGYDSLVGSWTTPGLINDDNGGSGYTIYRVVHYIAVAVGAAGAYSMPSREVYEQVGTSLKFTRAAFIERIKAILEAEAAITTSRLYGYVVKTEKRDPNPFKKSIYIVDGSPEFPEIQYATQRLENQLPIDILIMRKTGSSRGGKLSNDLVVERVLQLLAINYRWNENCYDTLIEEVEPFDEREGAVPHFPVARITLRGLSQYMRFQP